MNSTPKKPDLTERQQIALGYTISPQTRLSIAITFLQGDKNIGNKIPEWVWKKVALAATIRGDVTILQQAYDFFGGTYPPKDMYVRCGINAIKNGQVHSAIIAYEKTGSTIPKRAFLNLGFKLLSNYEKDDSTFQEALRIYEHLKIPPPNELLKKIRDISKRRYQLSRYTSVCQLLGEQPDKKFPQECYEHYCLTLNSAGVQYVAEVMEKKMRRNFLIMLGKRAFLENKTDEGKEFFKMAYADDAI